MDQVHFLNLEYFVVRIWDLVWGFFVRFFSWFTGTPESTITGEGINSPVVTSHIVGSLSFTATQLALMGIAVSIILWAMALWVRIKLELYEHEEFHKRDAKYGGHGHEGGHEASHHEPVFHSAPIEVAPEPMPSHEPQRHQARFGEVERLASSAHESDWRRAILEADIMLGEALEAQGYRGNTVGERLKDANPLQMTTLQSAWAAHKVRNEIAHGGEGYHLSERDVRGAIDNFKRVFEELGFI